MEKIANYPNHPMTGWQQEETVLNYIKVMLNMTLENILTHYRAR